MKAPSLHWTLVRYVLVALVAYVFDIGVFDLLYSVGNFGLLTCNVAGKICTAIFGFLAHRYVTFQAKTHENILREAVKFALAALLNFPIATSLLFVIFHIWPNAVGAKVIADSIGVLGSFAIAKLFIFKTASTP